MASLVLHFVLLILLLQLLLQHQVLGKKLNVSRGSSPTPEETQGVQWSRGNLTSYKRIIHSDNGSFVLAFVPSAGLTAEFDLAIVMEQHILEDVVATVVHNLYKGASSVTDAVQAIVDYPSRYFFEPRFWSRNVTAVELLDTGNLIFYNSTNGVVWRSFDYPTDTLLPGRQLRMGMGLVTPEHDYAAILEEQGLVFQLVGFGTYYTWSSSRKDWNEQEPTMELKANEVSLNKASLSIEGSDVAFLRLTAKGDIVDFHFNINTMLWVQGNFSLVLSQNNSLCTLPRWCGDYKICELDGNCKDFLVRPSPLADSGVTCDEYHVAPNTTHFSISAKQPDILTATAFDCWTLCNCSSCSAIIYNATSRGCYIIQGHISGSFSRTRSNDMTMVYWSPYPSYGPSNRFEFRFILIIILLLAYIIPPVSCICCSQQLDLLGRQLSRFRQHLKRRLQHLILQEEAAELERVLGDAQGHLPQRFRYSTLKTATDNFSDNRKLGAGGFGSVYEAIMVDGQRLAVKELGGGNRQGVKQFVSEIASMASIGHINILRLHGFCIETFHRLLVYEYMSNSSLDRWLFNNKTEPTLSWEQRRSIALDVARGLAYLHEECREPILHLDVKPQNILLDDRLVAKVADFGMAKLLTDRDASKVETNVRGTPGYIAPEWLLHSIATKKCDVYSYGMVLLELVSGRRNLDLALIGSSNNTSLSNDDHDDDSSWYFPAWAAKQVQRGRIMRLVDERIAGSISEVEIRMMVWLAFWCIQERANLRPAMHEVVLLLEGHQEMKEPLMSFHFAVQGASTLGSMLDEVWITAPQEVSDESILLTMPTGTV